MNKIKPKVSIYGTRPEMAIVHGVVCSVFDKYNQDCIVTSGVGKKHSKRSLHYPGFAYDYRTKHINDRSVKMSILKDMREALPCCDIIFEHEGEPQEHYHVEFDDKFDEQYQSDKLFYKTHGKWPHRP